MILSVMAVAGTSSPANPAPSGSRTSDAISPGFFNPPPGVRPINAIVPSRFPHARRSYAWRIRGTKRELVTFTTPVQHVVVIYMENRTPEDLFGAYFASPAPNGTPLGDPRELDLVDPASTPLTPEPLNKMDDPNHEHEPGFTEKAGNNWSNGGFSYVESPSPGLTVPSVLNYLTLIEGFGYANHVLQSNEGPSFEATNTPLQLNLVACQARTLPRTGW
ncbi:MAG: hypothetical protein WA431_16300 [Candidatus Cybelea sp.]